MIAARKQPLPVMPLTNAVVGQELVFVAVEGGGGLTHRLAELGLTPGMRLEVINRGGGPFIVSARGSKLILGKGMAGRVMVRPVIR